MLLLETPTEVSATVVEATAAVRSGRLVMIVDEVGDTACLTAALKAVTADAMATFKEHGCGPMRVMASDGLGAVVSMSRDDRADGVPIEAAAQLVDLAGIGGAAASTRVADDFGQPVGSDCAVQLADRLGVAIVAAHEILRHHPLEDRIAKRVVETMIPTPQGLLEAVGYASANGDEYVALLHGDLRRRPTRVHVHVQCQVSDVFGGGACRCGVQLRSALEVLETTRGMVLYVWRTDGERLRHVALPPSAAGEAEDRPARDAAIARILCDLDVSPVDISSNESLDTQRLSALGVTVQSHRTN
jgi:GTP cyclohydrolase II